MAKRNSRGSVFDLSRRWSYYAKHPWKFVEDLYDRVLWFIQRGCRGYADCDSWDISTYLHSWMPEAVDSLLNGIGHPTSLCSDSFKPEGCTHGEAHQAEWHAILKKISDGFRASRIQDDHMSWHHQGVIGEMLENKKKEGLALFIKYYDCLWD